jgi:hypothetical protein
VKAAAQYGQRSTLKDQEMELTMKTTFLPIMGDKHKINFGGTK